MHEYVNVSVNSYDPAALAAKLTEKSGEGWEVVAIVPTGGDTTAFLRRAADGSSGMGADAMAGVSSGVSATMMAPVAEVAPAIAREPAATYEPAPRPTPEPVNEPAGWAVAPGPTPAAAPMPATTAAATVIGGGDTYAPSPPATPASSVPEAAQPTTPAGWYHDPSGRYELRYWDGSQWTEHVARGGQQFTDAPIA